MSRFPLALAAAVLLVMMLAGCQKKTPLPPPVPVPSAAERLAAGQKAFAAGDCAKALPALAEAVRLEPEAAEAHFLLGLCAARQNDPDRAETELSRAAAADPKNPRPLEALGILQYTRDRRDAAGKSFEAAVARGSTNAQVAYYQGNLAMFAGDCPAALLAYRRAMTLDASFAPALAEYRAARLACAKAETKTAKPVPAQPAKPKAPPKTKPAQSPHAASGPQPAAAQPTTAQPASAAP